MMKVPPPSNFPLSREKITLLAGTKAERVSARVRNQTVYNKYCSIEEPSTSGSPETSNLIENLWMYRSCRWMFPFPRLGEYSADRARGERISNICLLSVILSHLRP